MTGQVRLRRNAKAERDLREEGAGPPADQVAKHFDAIGKVAPDLPGQVARFVIEGDNPSVLSTLQGQAARAAWQERSYDYRRLDEAEVFTDVAVWRPDQMRRLGEALAALEPLGHIYYYFGTPTSPDWLRHVVAVWLDRHRRQEPISALLALVEDREDQTVLILDILFGDYPSSRSARSNVDRLAGAGQWLAGAGAEIQAVLPELSVEVKAGLVGEIGRSKLHATYFDLLLDIATGSSKKARTAARQALTGADAEALAALLRTHYQAAAPGRKIALVEVASATLGAAVTRLLAVWRASESAAKVRAALDRLSATLTTVAPSRGPEKLSPRPADGPQGYAAVDGSWVEAPALDPLPGPSPIPPEVLRRLEPAMAEFNRLLAAAKAEGKDEIWHWSHDCKTKNWHDLEQVARLAEGSQPFIMPGDRQAIEWLEHYELKHPAVREFLDDPRLTLHHLVRLAAARGSGRIYGMLGEDSGPIGAAVQHRLATGADIRTVLALWLAAGGGDPIEDHLKSHWADSLPEMETPLWPVLCQRLALLDEAMGLAPQAGRDGLRRTRAIELLGLFPKLPERYRAPLMLLADDSSAQLRQAARALLQHTPGLGGAIALQLKDGKQETRARAADWLAARGDREQVPAIRAALARERGDLARAALITALERLGEEVSDYFDPARLLTEAKAGLAKPRPKGLDWLPFDRLPALTWKDGTPVDPLLPQWWIVLAARLKQPGGNALINLWLDRLQGDDAHRLGWMILTGWIDEDTRLPSDEEANAYALQHVDATVKQNLGWATPFSNGAGPWPTDRDLVFAQLKREKAATCLGSGTACKGVLALATRVNGADAAQRIRPFLKDHGHRTAQAKALLDLLAAIGTGSALQLLLSAADRSKQRTVQGHAAQLVEAVAERNGWSASQLADRTVPTAGFDSDGTQELDGGDNRVYRLQLDAQDAVILLTAEGRAVKALPGPRNDAERPAVEAAKKRLAMVRKEVKQVLATQAERLHGAMCLQRRWTRADWESFVAGHAIVGRLANRLVWQGLDSEGQPVATFRPLGDGSHSDAADGAVHLATVVEIRLAHALVLDDESASAWRRHLADYGVTPPFEQFGSERRRLAEGQGGALEITDREGWMIEGLKLRSATTRRGYRRGLQVGSGWFTTYEKPWREAGLVAQIEFTGNLLPEEDRPTALQSLSFRALRGGSAAGRKLALGDVPPVLLAECWHDLHDIAARGTGFDPEWLQKGQP